MGKLEGILKDLESTLETISDVKLRIQTITIETAPITIIFHRKDQVSQFEIYEEGSE